MSEQTKKVMAEHLYTLIDRKSDETTKDQRFFINAHGQKKAIIDVSPGPDNIGPSISDCRHAVLPLANKGHGPLYVVYDRLLGRIVNGVFAHPSDSDPQPTLDAVLDVARRYNENPDSPQDMAPGGALGLIYPGPKQEKQEDQEEE